MKSKIIQDFLVELKSKLAVAGPADAIGLSRLYGNIAWNNPVGIYRADDIEDLLYEKVAGLRDVVLARADLTKNGKILHVLTEGYASGGHTRVIERLIAVQRKDLPSQDIVIVEICPREVVEKLANLSTTVRLISQTGLRAIPVLSRMMAEYSDVVLHIHPDDIVSTLCARIAKESGTRIALYNHADHCFTYGMSSVDVLCEISAFGKKISNSFRPDIRASFAGIPLNIGVPVPRMDNGSTTVLSSGPAYKFDLSDGGVFATIVERVVSQLGLRMMLIGPGRLPADASSRLVGYVESGMLVITPPVDYEVYLEHVNKCICYIDSAPVTGGSALPEAALAGVPCAGLANAIMGYSPIDAIRSDSVNALVDRIKAFRDGVDCTSQKLKNELVLVHAPESVLQRITQSVNRQKDFALPYAIDEAALDIAFPQKQWLQHPEIFIHTRAFDFMPFGKRISLFFLMTRYGLMAKIPAITSLKNFSSNIAMRRMRNS